MNDQFMLLPVVLLNTQMTTELRKCNEYTTKYGLQLSEADITALVENRKEALESNGRIEFGGGVMKQIIIEFSDSPYLYQDNYVEILSELQECFYYFKNETEDEVTDEELIHIMNKYFDGICQGSLEYLKSTIMENYSRDIRYGINEYSKNSGYDEDYDDFLDLDKDEYDF